ncbi:MAG: hypothetical protein OXI60_00720 [Acidiferrobacterales bacterium]|nr:hypothetical protein [Acidiferrobacterales bacterium]
MQQDKRIKFLKSETEDDEIPVNSQSKDDFFKFVTTNRRIRIGDVAVTDEGNPRAVWRDDKQSFLGLQSMGDKNIQFAIFKRRSNSPVSRVTGRGTFEGVSEQVKAFQLDSLIYK